MCTLAVHDSDTSSPSKRPRELALSAAWHGGLTRSLLTVDGEAVSIVFAGNWSHGHGPDFSNAMLEIPGRGLVTGAVELHHHASDWIRHGHHLDSRYNDVVLHVVSKLDGGETRRADGSLVPIAVITVPDETLFRIDARLPKIWSGLGGETCAEDLVRDEPLRILRALRRLGDRRLAERVTRIEGDLTAYSPRDLLTVLLLEALGFSENRQPMRDLGERLNTCNWTGRAAAAPASSRATVIQALLFGLAGFLPFAPIDAHLSGLSPEETTTIEAVWTTRIRESAGLEPLVPTAWVRARTRPANHPAARIAVAARLLRSIANDPVGEVLESVSAGTGPVQWLQSLAAGTSSPALGPSRATAIVATVILPLTIAIARQSGDLAREDAAAYHWEQLRASEWSRPAKRAMTQVAGSHRLRGLGERGNQGLIKLDHAYCTPRRCFECPIAAEVVRSELGKA